MRPSAGTVLAGACAIWGASGCRAGTPRQSATRDPNASTTAARTREVSRPADASAPRRLPDPILRTPPGDPWEGPPRAAGLDWRAIERVREAHKADVRRTCWTTAFAARAAAEHSSATVKAVVTIAPSGDVSNVVILGDVSAYPGLANCLASRVQTWKFPKGEGSVTATLPFDLYGAP